VSQKNDTSAAKGVKSYLYKITRLSTSEVYFGVTVQPPEVRWARHKRGHHNPKLHRAIKKHGEQEFQFAVVQQLGSWKEALSAERNAIASAKQAGLQLYNATDGGEGCLGYKWPEERRRRHSMRMQGNSYGKGHKLSPEHAAKLKAAADKVNTPEQMQRMRAARWRK
jgi:group I intron endonuclease